MSNDNSIENDVCRYPIEDSGFFHAQKHFHAVSLSGGKDSTCLLLLMIERGIIDRCVRNVYRDYLGDPRPENMPILEDLYNELRGQEEKEAQYIATALEIYVSGSLNVFNHRTNINIENRIVK